MHPAEIRCPSWNSSRTPEVAIFQTVAVREVIVATAAIQVLLAFTVIKNKEQEGPKGSIFS